MKILLSSYSFGAHRGSEAGVGWNVATGLAARGHEVWVLSTSEFRHLNTPALQEQGLPQLHLLEWDCGITDFNQAHSYKLWKKRIQPQLKKLCQEEKFDLIHHLTFNQYRAIRELFATNTPYICGPIGGAETIAPVFFKELPLLSKIKELLRYIPLDAIPLGLRVKKYDQKGLFLASGPQTHKRLQETARLQGTLLSPIIAVKAEEIIESPLPPVQEESYLLYTGGLRADKGPMITLRAFAHLWKSGYHITLKMVAIPEAGHKNLGRKIARLGLPPQAVQLLPFISREELLPLMKGAKAFLCFNFRDSGSMALLEAIALGIPSLCFDNPEQFWLPHDFASKLSIQGLNLAQIEEHMAQAIHKVCTAPPRDALWHQQRVAWLQRSMTWDARLDYFEQCYQHLLEGAPLPQEPQYQPSKPRLKVLLSCYACGPNYGSEAGMGWNFATQIAQYHDVHILVEKDEFEEKVTTYSQEHPEKVAHMHFHFIRRKHHETLRLFWPPSYYWFYRAWLKKAYQYAIELDREHHFDLSHHITIAGYREPGYLWKLDKPFIWGPVGGHSNSPWCLIPSLGLRGILHFGSRNILNSIQKRWGRASRAAAKAARFIMTSNSTAQEDIQKHWQRDTSFMSEIGCNLEDIRPTFTVHHSGTPLQICWVGETVIGKAAHILFQALLLCHEPMELHLYGKGRKLEDWRKMVLKMGLSKRVFIHGFVPQKEVWQQMAQSHVLCITSIRDDTSAVILEGFRYGLPAIALDYTGFRDAITQDCGIKIPIHNKKQIIQAYAQALDELACDETKRQKLAQGALRRSRDYLWSEKMKTINQLYAQSCPYWQAEEK